MAFEVQPVGNDPSEDNIDALFEDIYDAEDLSVPAPVDHDALAASLVRPNAKHNDPFAPSAYDDLPEGQGPETNTSKSTTLRRPAAKLDEDRLLNNPAGFQKLIQLSKDFKFGPKGSEREDLKRVMKMYRMWTHALYPKGKFKDSIETVEKICRKRPLQSALKEWREEASGLSNKRKHGPEEQLPQTPPVASAETTANLAPNVESTSAPLFRQADEEKDEFDIDDGFDQLLQEMDVSAPTTKQATSGLKTLFESDPDDDFAEEEALMREYEEFEAAKRAAAAVCQPRTDIVPTSSDALRDSNATIFQADTGETRDLDEPNWDDLYS